MSRPSLLEIAQAKGTDKQGAHHYAEQYERHFGHLRDKPIRLLEIGIGGYADPNRGGASLRMWKEFFPRAEIVGLDIHEKASLAEERITVVQGDQSDAAFLDAMATRNGPFDIVVDDGSHVSAHVIASFRALFPHLNESGIYAIEDLQTSYWKRTFGGSSDADREGTSMTFFKGLADGLNHAEFDIPYYVPSYFDRWVMSLTFYHNIAFIQKGANVEPSNFLPPHPRPRRLFDSPSRSQRVRKPANPLRRWFRTAAPRSVRALMVKPLRWLAAAIAGRDRSA